MSEYEFRMYVQRPAQEGSGYEFGKIGRAEGGAAKIGQTSDGYPDPGHAFVGLVDDKGNEQRCGFYPGEPLRMTGDRGRDIQEAFRGIPGQVRDDTGHPYDDCISYPINKEQYDKINTHIHNCQNHPPDYVLTTNNCVTFCRDSAKAGGIQPPAQRGFFDNPAAYGPAVEQAAHQQQAQAKQPEHAHEGREPHSSHTSDPQPDSKTRETPEKKEPTQRPKMSF